MDGASARSLDVTMFLERRGTTPFHIRLLVISCFVTFFDGLDFSLIAYTLPYLRDVMALDDAMTGYVSSAAFLGQMIGSLVGSYIADVVGRRPVIIWCTFLSAVLTFLTGFASNPYELIVLRLLGGLAIGGLLAPVWSINIETMPSGTKARAVTIIMLGFSGGSAAAGQITNWLAPQYGWEGVFFFCGGTTLVLAIGLLFTMPESARWLVARGKPKALIAPLLSRMDPAADLDRYENFHLSDERKVSTEVRAGAGAVERTVGKFLKAMGQLFHGWLGAITPLIWATYFCSSFAIYLKSSFGVLFLEELGIARETAANLGSIGGIIGAVAGVVLLWFTEKRGPAWIAIAPAIGIPLALAIGSGALLDGPLFVPVILFGSVAIGACHAAVISITSIYYPSAIRSTGGGWASFMAKFAAVAAPIIGGWYFLSDQQAVLHGYQATALCLLGVVLGLMALAVFARKLQADRQSKAQEGVAVPAE